MEVDEVPDSGSAASKVEKTNNLLSTAATASVSVSLHPLVILNVSDHWTRMRAQTGESKQVIGALIGSQKGRHIEVINSFELRWDNVPAEGIIIDRDYYNTKEGQFKQVFKDLDFLGWYTTGDTLGPDESDAAIHRQICEISEGPIFLKMAPGMPRALMSSGTLPVMFYESVIDVVAGNATLLFVDVNWTLATEEAERIGLDHMARMRSMSCSMSGSEKESGSLAADHLRVQYSAVKMLRDRIAILLEYAKDVQTGVRAWDHDVMRDLASLCRRLPAITGDSFQKQFYSQYNDVALISYLASVSKGTNSMNQFIQKYNLLYDRPQGTRRVRTLYL